MSQVKTSLGSPSPLSRVSPFLGLLLSSSLFLASRDGRAAEPERLTALSEGPWGLAVLGDRVFFVADDGEHGEELWVSDGTLAGTSLFHESRPGPDGPGCRGRPVVIGDRLVFPASSGDSDGDRIWVSDGTPEGTELARTPGGEEVGALPWGILCWSWAYARTADRIFVLSGEYDHFWVSDGSAEGSWWEAGFPLGSKGSGHPFVATGEALFFFSSGVGFEGNNYTLWALDERGHRLLLQILDPWPFPPFRGESLRAAGDRIYFFLDGLLGELWTTDGTSEGTTPFRELLGQPEEWRAEIPVQVGERLFFAAQDGEHGLELWVSDGMPDGTRLVRDIEPGEPGSSLYSFRAVGDRLFFRIADELWVSDGTREGTVPFRELLGQPETWRANADITPVEVDGLLFFVADDGERGQELWVSDGTREGTRIVAETVPGPESSFPLDMFPATPSITPAGDRLFFTAIAPGLGPQLWVLDLRDLDHRFRRADCNSDGALDISDAITTLGSLFLGEEQPSCADACDANDDGEVDISDAITTLGVLFLGQLEIPPPGTQSCGGDPTPDRLTCQTTEHCP